jgi:diacylglycerol kinase family enzyme
MYVQMDGEPADGDGGVTIQVRPKALRVLAPQQTPHPLFGSSCNEAG